MIGYAWQGNQIEPREHTTVAICADPVVAHWIRGVLRLIPMERRQPTGTLGVNFFRIFLL